jgi:hypothetical protein
VKVVSEASCEPLIWYGMFYVGLASDERGEPTDDLMDADFVGCGRSILVCMSAFSSHQVRVHLQHLTGRPELAEPGQWERVHVGRVQYGGGAVEVVDTDGRTYSDSLVLDDADGWYGVRVCCEGRAAVRDPRWAVEGPPPGTERWLIQFWRVAT